MTFREKLNALVAAEGVRVGDGIEQAMDALAEAVWEAGPEHFQGRREEAAQQELDGCPLDGLDAVGEWQVDGDVWRCDVSGPGWRRTLVVKFPAGSDEPSESYLE